MTVVEARLQPVEERLRVLARVEALVQPQVVAETAGRVRAVHVEPGDAVEAGALLFELEDRDQRLAARRGRGRQRAAPRPPRASRSASSQRLEQLGRRDAASRAARDEARAQRQALAAQLAEAEAALAAARLALERTRIVSPVAGIVDQRLVSLGRLGGARETGGGTGRPRGAAAGARPAREPGPAARPRPAAARRPARRGASGDGGRRAAAGAQPGGTRARGPGHGLRAGSGAAPPRDAPARRARARRRARACGCRRRRWWSAAAARWSTWSRRAGRGRGRWSSGVRRDGFVEVREGVEPGRRVVVEGSGFLAEGVPVAERGEGA
ncbi:MAG: biotin/lipoyl-binding protein [Xanthomonadales bacterium]|nr:biotin/lipoyl-binding protein [Xanthomonadales bacterium]